MKLLVIFLIVFIASFSFSQSGNLVQHEINADVVVTSLKVTAHISEDNINNDLDRIESVYDSTIKLQLYPDVSYTVLINNHIIVEIEKNDGTNLMVENGENNPSNPNTANIVSSSDINNHYQTESSNNVQYGLDYRIQIGAFSKTNLGDYFEAVTDLKTEKITGTRITRYMTGSFPNVSEARSSLSAIKQKGYKDAFVVVCLDGKRISNKKAIAFLKEKKENRNIKNVASND